MPIKVSSLTPLLQIYDMPRSAAFYRDILGFEIVMQSQPGEHFHWALLRLGEVELMLNTMFESDEERPAHLDPSRIVGHSDMTLYFGCADVDEAWKYLRSKGVTVTEPVIQRYGMKQITVIDPDGYQLCFQHPGEGGG
jgi:glyoxylase I family protein